jgi:acyl-CoA synthetase (AMP-forming)/AMP-acid ligase II
MTRLDRLFDELGTYGELPCMSDGAVSFTYSDLLAECARWHHRIEQMSIAPGRVVGLQADYSLTAAAALLTLLSRKLVVAMIPRDGEISRYLQDAHAQELLSIGIDGQVNRQSISGAEDHPLLSRLQNDGDGGLIIFTSGSSGRPKAALQSSERFLSKFKKTGRRFRTVAFLMFDHIAGLDTLFYTLSSGGALIVTRHRDPASILELIERQKAEVLPASPSFLRLLCVTHSSESRDLSSLKIITYGSEPMDTTTLKILNERFPNVQINQKYGTTETGSPKSVSRGNDSLWLKLKTDKASGVETKIVDGMLWIRSESTILGYLNAPSPIDEDGWYCTGDLVDVDGEWIRFRGRASDTINVGGEKVSPTEVEQTILELPMVRSAVVSGEKHALMGFIVTARVALSEAVDAQDAVKQIRSHCASRLARYKVPIKIDVVEDLLVSDRQKKQRQTSEG